MKKATAKEAKAIAGLRRAFRSWPKTLWVFVDGNGIHVMAKKDDGRIALTGGEGSGFDPDFIVDTIRGVQCDGGDW
jgi:hypothetical protein